MKISFLAVIKCIKTFVSECFVIYMAPVIKRKFCILLFPTDMFPHFPDDNLTNNVLSLRLIKLKIRPHRLQNRNRKTDISYKQFLRKHAIVGKL
jgi:hypothetical protein